MKIKEENERFLKIELDGKGYGDRDNFVSQPRKIIMNWIGEIMGVDIMFSDMLKNIYDHVDGKTGSIELEKLPNGRIKFDVCDTGTKSFDYEHCSKNSRLAGKTGQNFGCDLRMFPATAVELEIEDYKVDTSKGFHYSGVYTLRDVREARKRSTKS